jgi:hypothetical protein
MHVNLEITMRFTVFAAVAALAFALGVAATPVANSELAKRCVGGRDLFDSVEEFEKRLVNAYIIHKRAMSLTPLVRCNCSPDC